MVSAREQFLEPHLYQILQKMKSVIFASLSHPKGSGAAFSSPPEDCLKLGEKACVCFCKLQNSPYWLKNAISCFLRFPCWFPQPQNTLKGRKKITCIFTLKTRCGLSTRDHSEANRGFRKSQVELSLVQCRS